jgi:hypothetical protein
MAADVHAVPLILSWSSASQSLLNKRGQSNKMIAAFMAWGCGLLVVRWILLTGNIAGKINILRIGDVSIRLKIHHAAMTVEA